MSLLTVRMDWISSLRTLECGFHSSLAKEVEPTCVVS
jgi:hypothetical protein